MKTILDSESIVGAATWQGEPMEVCSVAACRHLPGSNELRVHLDNFLRPQNPARHKEHHKAPWLPLPQDLREGVSAEEALSMARDIASSWRKKVAASIPDKSPP
jgi:hypothetical protein